MTLLFRDDAYIKSIDAEVIGVEGNGVRLNQTIFYPTGGGQPGDSGTMTLVGDGGADGTALTIAEARKGENMDDVVHYLAEGSAVPAVGDKVTLSLDWGRRYKHMRFHTAMHIMCSLIEGDVTGGNMTDQKARLDFNLPDGFPEKEVLNEKLAAAIAGNHGVSTVWISDEELDANPDLVRTMSVQPPRGSGKVRLLEIDSVDLQPCGGTHLAATGEVGDVFVSKIENKGKMNRRFTLRFKSDL